MHELDTVMDFLLQPWAWYVSGPLIALTMTALLFLGRTFGMSSNLRTLCTLVGAGKFADFFRFDWRSHGWNLVFALGALVGGFLMATLGTHAGDVHLAESVTQNVKALGLDADGAFAPVALFGKPGQWPPLSGLLSLIAGGFLIGFGSRWAGGCTSGHAISGLSDLQKGSLIAVVGFFAGGLIMTWFILPHLFSPGGL